MIWKFVWGDTLPKFINNFNTEMRSVFINLYENAKFKVLGIKEGTTEPKTELGIAKIYSDSPGVLKIKFSDGTIKTFTLT